MNANDYSNAVQLSWNVQTGETQTQSKSLFKSLNASNSFPDPCVTNEHQIKVWYDEYTGPWPGSKRIGAIHAELDQKSSGNSDMISKIIFADQPFLDPFRRG